MAVKGQWESAEPTKEPVLISLTCLSVTSRVCRCVSQCVGVCVCVLFIYWRLVFDFASLVLGTCPSPSILFSFGKFRLDLSDS